MLNAPAARMTSRLASTRRRTPGLAAGLRTGPVEIAARAVFDADGAQPLVEQDAGRQRIEDDAEVVGLHRAFEALARAAPAPPRGRERRERQALRQPPLQTPVVRIVFAVEDAPVAFDEPPDRAPKAGESATAPDVEIAGDRADDRPDQPAVAERLHGRRDFDVEPAGPAVPGRVDASAAEAGDPAPERPVAAVLDAPEIAAHDVGAPRRIAGQRGDRVPVRIARRHQDHGVVGGAAAERRGARVEDAGPPGSVDAGPALGVVAEVVDAVVPGDRPVFRGERMERGNLGILGQALGAKGRGIGAGFQHHYAHAGLGESRRKRPAARARADDDVVDRLVPRLGHRQKVLR